MRVDEAGEDILAARVDLSVGGEAAGSAVERDGVEGYDGGDAVVLDEDVEGAGGGRTAAIDDDGVADGEARVAAAAGGRRLREGCGSGEDERESEEAHGRPEATLHYINDWRS